MSTLYVDIDSTIWPAELQYDKAAMELFGIPYGSDWYDVSELIAKFGPDYKQIFRHALDPRNIPDRVLYEGVPWALYVLRGQGFDIHFISHNDPDLMQPIAEWLEQSFMHLPFAVTVDSVDRLDKVEHMADDSNAWGIIEDKVSTLVDAADAGYVTLCKSQPWNRLITGVRHDIIAFDNWLVAPALVMGARKEVLV